MVDDKKWLPIVLTLLSMVTTTGQNVRQKRQIMADLPRIITENGHLIFQSGQSYNITFRSGRGGVYIDDIDLKSTAQQTKDNKASIQSIQTSLGSGSINVTHRLGSIENQLTLLSHVPSRVNSLSNTVNILRDQTNRNLSTLNTRVRQIESRTGNSNLQSHITDLRTRIENLENTNRTSSQEASSRRLRRRVDRLEERLNQLQQQLRNNECDSNPCLNGGTCLDLFNKYQCICPSNWQGENCNADVNECYMYSGTSLGCANGATCINTLGGFSCNCPANYHGVHCRESHDDCTGGSNNELCGHGQCFNVPRTIIGQPKYSCICESGWKSSAGNPACNVDIDECATGRHCSTDPPVACINTPGSFICGSCPAGYVGNGFTCSDINECAINNGGCSTSPFVQCTNTRGSRSCAQCPAGYQGDGITCNFVGFCSVNNGGCHSLATCSEGGGMRFCMCPQGYAGSGVGPTGCVTQSLAGACASNPCQNGAACSPVGLTAFLCACPPGYTGTVCNTAVNACTINPCQNNGVCVQRTNAPFYTCNCTEDYTGINCQTQQDGCGGTLNGEVGTLRYPRVIGQFYNHNIDCEWVISTTVNKIIMVQFQNFSLEDGAHCRFDYLQVNDGGHLYSPMLGRYCGNTLPNNGSLNSTFDQMFMKLHTDHSVHNYGFQLQWTSYPKTCGSYITNTSYGNIYSPGYPGDYPQNIDCVWIIAVNAGNTINIHFSQLLLEAHGNCNFDYLEFRDGETPDSPLINKFCTDTPPAPIRTTGPYAFIKFHTDHSVAFPGFHITYAAQPDLRGCGGVYTSDQGVISTPGYPATYVNNGLCVWVIRLLPSTRVQLIINDLNFGQENDCLFHSLTIRNGLDQLSPVVRQFCSSQTNLDSVTSSKTVMNIELHTAPSVSVKFKAQWTSVCGGVYTESEGLIQSPNWPNNYPNGITCTYKIQVSDNSRVHLRFTAFDLESHDSCDYDYIEIFDGPDENQVQLGSSHCGVSMPNDIMSTGNTMFLRFVTDGSFTHSGFQATYTSAERGPGGCGGVLRANHSLISSPGFPNQYPHGINCTWYIFAPPGFLINLTFTTFQFTSRYDNNCGTDFVEVYDNSTTAQQDKFGRWCGTTSPGSITSTNNVLTVYMETGSSEPNVGFMAAYTIVNASSVCGSTLLQPSGEITSRNYPNQYPPNLQCVWTITVPAGNHILLNISDINILQTAACNMDFLEIRNGGDQSSPLINRFCGDNPPMDLIISHSNRLYLFFKSSYYTQGNGFRVVYTSEQAECGADSTFASGGIISPNYPHPYPINAQCIYTITVSQGSRISVHFLDFDLEGGYCNYDFLEIRETDMNGPQLHKLCGNNHSPDPFTSSTNKLWMRFETDYSLNYRGFHLRYNSNCNQNLTGNTGIIESPNFPNPLTSAANCTWIIQVPNGNTVNISFAAFALPNSYNCDSSFLQIKDGGDSNAGQLLKQCGSTLPNQISSTGNKVWIHFVSDSFYASNNGFRLEWIVNGCGGSLIGNNGTITSPGYPNLYPTLRECEWSITVDSGKSIQFTLSQFDMESSRNCLFDALEIYAGSNKQGPRIGQWCHRESAAQIVHTTGNKAFVYFKSDVNVQGTGFKLDYQSLQQGCGGNFTARSATITSINYPNEYEHNILCEWLITVVPGHVVNLSINDFHLEGNSNRCIYDYLKIYDGSNSNADLIATLCGILSNATMYKSSGNQMYLRMQTDSSATFKGFSANYTTGCGGTLNADIDGAISSPYYPANYPTNTNCVWIISSIQHERQVSLTFTHLSMNINCLEDNVTVFEGSNPTINSTSQVQNVFCGNSIPGTITSVGSALTVVFQSGLYFSSGNGFRAVYSSAIHSCGAELTAMSGHFNSPNYPESYPADVECIWVIRPPPGNRIQISFLQFQLDPTGGLSDDYVEIRSPDVSGSIIGRWIGNSAPTNLQPLYGAWIKFRSNEGNTAQGFRAQYSSLFGGELVGDSGQIASPNYPTFYTSGADYRWTVVVSQGKRIKIEFSHFDIQPPLYQNEECDDFVQIFDGREEDGNALGKFCGVTKPSTVYSQSNQITVVFTTDSSYEASGFLLDWLAVTNEEVPPRATSQVPGCGGNLVAEETVQNFTSPGFPENYSPNLMCTWSITVPQGYRVVTNITSMDIYQSMGCYEDFLRFSTTYVPMCGSEGVGQVIKSYSNNLLVFFRTDNSNSGQGFSIDYGRGCGGYLNTQEGVIQSPGYPSQYLPNQECSWTITVLNGQTISINFTGIFNIADSGECNNDYILLLNGYYESSPPLYNNGSTNTNGRYCGTSPPQNLKTSSNSLHIRFITDGSNESSGFSLSYRAVSVACGGHLRLTSSVSIQYIQSPNYPDGYPLNVECVWIIVAPASKRIQVDFVDFHLAAYTGSGCIYEFVEFRDGGTVNAQRIGNSYCGILTPGTVTSLGNVLYVRFKTMSYTSGRGFKARLSFATCGGRIVANSGTIQSPNYPNNYDNNLDCEWTIVGSEFHYLTINITDFSLQLSDNCTADSLVIKDGNSNGTVLFNDCFHMMSITSVSTSDNTAYIRFKSDATISFQGFRIDFQASIEECGGRMTLPSATISSPGYPRPYQHNRVCTWYITVQPGRRITFTFNAIDLEERYGYCFDYVEIFNGINTGSPMIGKYCSSPLTEIESSGNTMKVVFRSDYSIHNNGFQATYTSNNDAVCGGLLTDRSGNITSPPANGTGTSGSGYNAQCVWRLRNHNANSSIVLYFVNNSEQTQANCVDNFVEIREGTDENSPIINKLCFYRQQSEFIATASQDVWIRYVASEYVSFVLSYEFFDCGGILRDTAGVITNPNNLSTSLLPSVACSWKIIAPEGTRIKFQLNNGSSSESLQIQNGGLPDSPTMTIPPSRPFITSQSNELRLTFKPNTTSSNVSFRINYNFDSDGCGIVYHSNEGSFSTPNYPRSYPHNIQCQWDINVPSGFTINLTFIPPFDLQHSGAETVNCTRDFVEVFDVLPNDNLTSLGRWCYHTTPPQQKSSSNRLVVVFQSDATTNGNGFSARWESYCGGIFTDTEGVLISPGYPDKYPNNVNCNYLINPGSKYHIALTFTDFEMQRYGDYLIVYQGVRASSYQHYYGSGTRYLGSYSGSNTPGVINAKSPISLQLLTDDSEQFKGFRAKYISEECGGDFTDPSGQITLPHSQIRYAHYTNCSWNITVDPDRIIRLKFTSFKVEFHQSCIWDSVNIYDGPNTNSTRLGKFCGTIDNIPEYIFSTGNQMYITFLTDFSVNDDGFEGYYQSTYGPAQGCGGILQQTQGNLRSNYGNQGQYEAYLFCAWNIYVEVNNNVVLTISGLDIETSENCTHDSLKIYDGTSQHQELLMNLCGQTRPQSSIVSSSNALYVVFKTDGAGFGNGFVASFTQRPSLCGGIYNATNTSVTASSPSYPHSANVSVICSWFIDSLQSNSFVRITVTDFQLQGGDGCVNESLTFKDELVANNGQNLVYCGESIPHPFTSLGSKMRITYKLQNPQPLRGFQFTYQIADCNQNISASSGRITSPGHPINYPHNKFCTIHITSPENTTLALYFKSFQLENHCVYDYLKITNSSSSTIATLCGTALPEPVFFTDNDVILEFKTDDSVSRSGYDITFISSTQGIGCGGTLTHVPVGVFTSPDYPFSYSAAATCGWQINNQYGTLFWRISFLPSESSNCETDYVNLYSGLANSGPLIQQFCGDMSQFSNGVTSQPMGQMFLQYVSSGNGTAPIFRFQFATSINSLN